MNKDNVFYSRLTQEAAERNKSINEIERVLGYPRNALQNYKNGAEPSGSRLVELANYFHVTPDYLMGKDEDFKSPIINILFEELSDKQKLEMFKLCQKWLETQVKN